MTATQEQPKSKTTPPPAAATPPPQPAPQPAQLAAAAAAKRMTLANIVSGTIKKPPRILVYGVDGIGKSTFASCAPAPIFIGLEDGTATLDVPRFPEPRNWLDTLTAVDELLKPGHSFQTLVIDSLDWLEPLCWQHVVDIGPKRNRDGSPIETIEDFAYGRGYFAAIDEWRVLLSKLDALRTQRGMVIVLIAHAIIASFKNPEGDDFDRFGLKLQSSKKADTAGLIREWCDAVLFATHEQYTHKPSKDKAARAKGIATGARILHTQRGAAFDAKNRYNLPPTLPLDWPSLADAIGVGRPAAALRARIEAQLGGAAEDLQTRVRAAMAKAGDDARELVRIENKLAAQLNIADKETAT